MVISFHPSENSIKNEPPRESGVHQNLSELLIRMPHWRGGERERERKRQRQRSVKQEREIYPILLKIWIEKKTNHTCVKKKEKDHFQLMGKRNKKDTILALLLIQWFFSSKVKSRRLELVVSSKWKTLAIPKMYVLLKFCKTLKFLKAIAIIPSKTQQFSAYSGITFPMHQAWNPTIMFY